jgi:HD-GYP domain-containing protein (c-di-GMP phosphodiesterase class II)
VLTFVADHHERLDGSGYPRGLRADAISLGGLIVGASDLFDALTSPRAYRDAMDAGDTLRYIEQLGPSGVSPTVFPALARVVRGGQVLVFLDDV